MHVHSYKMNYCEVFDSPNSVVIMQYSGVTLPVVVCV